MLISSVTTLKLEDIVKGGNGPKIYQLYVRGDDKWVAERVKQAMGAGYDAFCITVDTAVYSRRERDIAKRFVKSWRTAATGQDHQAAFSWDNFKRVKDQFPDVKFMLKGIGCGEDAEIASRKACGASTAPTMAAASSTMAAARRRCCRRSSRSAKGKAKIIVDGSFSRGTDIVKAICLGADWVGMGRLYCYGLAANGAAGIERVVELLEEEMKEVMGLLGVSSLSSSTRATSARPCRPTCPACTAPSRCCTRGMTLDPPPHRRRPREPQSRSARVIMI